MEFVSDESGTDEEEGYWKIVNRRNAPGAIRSIKYARALHEDLLGPILMYESEKSVWRKERFWVRAVQRDNLRSLLGAQANRQNTECTSCIALRKMG